MSISFDFMTGQDDVTRPTAADRARLLAEIGRLLGEALAADYLKARRAAMEASRGGIDHTPGALDKSAEDAIRRDPRQPLENERQRPATRREGRRVRSGRVA